MGGSGMTGGGMCCGRGGPAHGGAGDAMCALGACVCSGGLPRVANEHAPSLVSSFSSPAAVATLLGVACRRRGKPWEPGV